MLADWIKGARWWNRDANFSYYTRATILSSPPFPPRRSTWWRWTRRVKLMIFQYFSILFSILLSLSQVRLAFSLSLFLFFCSLSFLAHYSCFFSHLPTHAQHKHLSRSCHWQRCDARGYQISSAVSLAEKISYRHGTLHRERKRERISNKYSTGWETPRNLLGCCFFSPTCVISMKARTPLRMCIPPQDKFIAL